MFHHALHRFYHFLLPVYCLMCGQLSPDHNNICVACQKDLPILTQSCHRCAQFLPFSQSTSTPVRLFSADDNHFQLEENNLTCGACLAKSPPFDRTFALFFYQTPIIEFVKNLKFKGDLPYALAFAQLFKKRINEVWYPNTPLPDLILPVPLHVKRLRGRGFNQTMEIAKPLARALRLPIDQQVKRTRATVAQSSLSAKQRKQNLTRAFASNRDYSGLAIAILDDVMTTGQTITELSILLKNQGAKMIHVWCCARC